MKNRQGELVISRLEEAQLQDIAQRTGGLYFRSRSDEQDLQRIYPQYQNFQIYLGLASESVSPDLLVHAKKEGIYLLQPEEDQITIIAS